MVDGVIQPVLGGEKLAGKGIGGDVAVPGLAVLTHAAVQPVQVAAGAERLFAGALQHHHGHRRVARPALQLFAEQLGHRQRKTIERARSVECGDADHRTIHPHPLFEQYRGLVVRAHAFFHCGARFSRKALTPSAWSALSNRSTKASRSATSAAAWVP